MRKEILRLNHISAHTKIELKSVSLELFEKEMIGITGLDDSGYMYVTDILKNEKLISSGYINKKSEIGVITRSNHWQLYEDRTVGENIYLLSGEQSLYRGVDWKKCYHMADEMIKVTEIGITSDQRVSELTECQKMIVQILKNIWMKKRILVLVQEGSILAPGESANLNIILKNIMDYYLCSFIRISGELDFLKESCSRIYLIRNGYTIYCLGKDEYRSSRVINYQKKHDVYSNMKKHVEEQGDSVVLSILGCIREDSKPFRIDVCQGELAGILDLGNKNCMNLGNCIKGECASEWHYFSEMCYDHPVTDADRKKIAVLTDQSIQYQFPDMSISDNLCMHVLENVSWFHRIFVSAKMQTVLKNEFLQELEEYQIPLDERTQTRYSDLTVEQKVCAAFFKLRITSPEILILDHSLFYYPISRGSLLLKLIGKFLEKRIAVLIIDNNIGQFIRQCSKKFVFTKDGYYGLFDNDTMISEDLLNERTIQS